MVILDKEFLTLKLKKSLFFFILPLVFLIFSIFLVLKLSFLPSESSPRVFAQTINECSKEDTANWCQLGRDSQHTGFTPENLGTNFRVAWTYAFQPERVHPQVQPIIYQNKVYVGTEMGNLYAINAQTGNKVWSFKADSSILNSVAAFNNKIYFATNKGSVYAIEASSGTQIWKKQLSNRAGFSVAPLIGDNKLLIGGRNGKFYALDLNNGSVLWIYDTGSHILMTAAYNQGKVFFGTMDMYFYALNSGNGSLVWKSPKIIGMSFKDYYPVVYQGKIIVLPLSKRMDAGLKPGFPFGWGTNVNWLAQYGPTIIAGNASQVPDFMSAQDKIMNNYLTNPTNYTLMVYILNESDGKIDPQAQTPHFDVQAHNGAKTPPCVDREGKLIIPVLFLQSGWGRVDLNIKRYVDVLYDGKNWDGQDYIIKDSNNNPIVNGNNVAGFGNSDENMNVSCTGNFILSFHSMEMNANYTGVFNMDTRRWTVIRKGWKNGQMFNVTESGGGNPPSVANGVVYHQSFNELIARTTQ